MRFTHLPLVVAFLVLSFSIRPTLVLAQSQNMLGHQSQNEGISVLLAPPVVKIDGDLSEWDWSSRIWVFADSAMRSRFSVEAAAMWDKENLYLAAKWKDPTPMFNTVDPEIDPYEGWKSDSWQVRVRTDKITHVTTWFHTPKAMPVVQIAYGKSLTEPFGGDGAFWVGKPHETNLGRGIEMAYKKDADGQGCTQEIKIPWVLLCEKPPTYKVGDKVQLGFEFLWGDPSGRSWPIHRYADNMQPGMTSREFYFTNFKAWGSAELFPAGHVPVREYVGDSDRLAGTIPVVATIPKASARFTLVIEDESGKRVRNLIGDGDPNDYAAAGGKPAGETRQVTVMWDGLDDKGKPVSPGKYRMRGLTHKGLGAEYEMCFYNPGTPPWPTAKGDGAWGADHSGPAAVAVGGGQTFIGSPVVEGGSGLIALDADGRKTWGEKRGVEKVAADGKYVYAVGRNSYMGNAYCLNRYAAKDGAYQPFVKDGKPLAFDLRIDTLFVPVLADAADAAAESDSDDAPAGDTGNLLNNVAVTAMAVQDGKLAVALNAGKIVLLDAATSELLMAFNAKKVSALAFGPRASLRVVADGALNEVEYDFSQLAPGRTIAADHLPKLKPLPTPGLGTAGAIAVDAEGNTLIADRGPDAQVKAYSREGKLAYTAGKKGGRSLRGTFDPQGMRDVVAVACDAKGQIWAVEGGNTPRRASVWGRDGKLVRDYIGNTNYSGTGCYLHDQDPSLAYCGPMEFKLDRTQNTATLTRVLWVPDPAAGEDFPIDPGAHVQPQRFTSQAAGGSHEYLYVHDPHSEGGQVVYMERDGQWKPVAAITTMGRIGSLGDKVARPAPKPARPRARNSVKSPAPAAPTPAPAPVSDVKPEFAPGDFCFWNDLNADGKVQIEECVVIPEAELRNPDKPWAKPPELTNGWGGRIAPDLTIYVDGITRFRPIGFAPDGAPRYGLAGTKSLGVDERGDLIPDPANKQLLCLSYKGYAGPTTGLLGIDEESGRIRWSYPNPYPGVHGSHNAPMPAPGLLVGPIKIMGLARVDDRIGNVMAMRGNLGQDFFVTSDGLYVGALFQDCRFPAEPLPDTEAMLRGQPMERYSEGGEPFNGWFGRQSDGKFRLTTGMPRQAAMILNVNGLESIERFDAPALSVDEAGLTKAAVDNAARASASGAEKSCVIHRAAAPPTLTGESGDWKAAPRLVIARAGMPEKAIARLAYDAENLYVRFDVTDASPWANQGKEPSELFKTGDAVDVQIGPAGDKPHADPAAGDRRVVIADLQGKPVAVLMAVVDPKSPPELHKSFTSPVGTKAFDRVEVLAAAKVAVKKGDGKYTVEAAIPWSALGVAPAAGTKLRGDVGFISSDARGTINVARTYWANSATNLVNDLPQEAWLHPQTWGAWTLE